MATVLEQCGGNNMVAGMVLEEFLNQVPTDIAEMEAALAGDDLLPGSKAAHRLKGTAGVLGATLLHPLCAEMEHVCKAGDMAKVKDVFVALKAESQRCVEAVPAAIETLK